MKKEGVNVTIDIVGKIIVSLSLCVNPISSLSFGLGLPGAGRFGREHFRPRVV